MEILDIDETNVTMVIVGRCMFLACNFAPENLLGANCFEVEDK